MNQCHANQIVDYSAGVSREQTLIEKSSQLKGTDFKCIVAAFSATSEPICVSDRDGERVRRSEGERDHKVIVCRHLSVLFSV